MKTWTEKVIEAKIESKDKFISSSKRKINSLIKEMLEQEKGQSDEFQRSILHFERENKKLIIENEELKKEIENSNFKKLSEENIFLKEKNSILEEKETKLIKRIEDLKTFGTPNDSDYLIKRDAELTALEDGGVDNWSWYGEAMEDYNSWLEENYPEDCE